MIKIKNLKKYLIFLWIVLSTFISGMINVYSVKVFKISSSHHTGNISNIAIQLYDKKTFNTILFLSVIIFFVGAAISGFIFHERNLELQRRYGIALLFCGIIVLFSEYINNNLIKLYILILIMGFQNGMFIKFDQILIRISHFTGYLTDAGFLLGRVLRGNYKDLKTILIYLISIIAFISGGIFSAYNIDKNNKSFIITGCFYIGVGVYYFVLRKTFSMIEKKSNIYKEEKVN